MPNPSIPVPTKRPISEDPAKKHKTEAAMMQLEMLANIKFLGDISLKMMEELEKLVLLDDH